jgi:hypothetical protein
MLQNFIADVRLALDFLAEHSLHVHFYNPELI